ncbi:DUF6507 family protein [Streptomyces boninensis]|uniref:DUF6507 family protein n=1 Tax=Streptomyces boninensis TaxID=2039455 RepID=UPI003B21E1D3
MTNWDIWPQSVRAVLKTTTGHVKDMGTAAQSLGESLQSAATNAGYLASTTEQMSAAADYKGGNAGQGGAGGGQRGGPVGAALAQFMEANTDRLQFLFNRTKASMTGAAEATNHYVVGDIDMAADAQSKATKYTSQIPLAIAPMVCSKDGGK